VDVAGQSTVLVTHSSRSFHLHTYYTRLPRYVNYRR